MVDRRYRFTHIVTVGTSILRNALVEARRGSRFLGVHSDVLSGLVETPPGREEVIVSPSSRVFSDLLAFVGYDPYGASAELKAFLSLLEDERLFPLVIPEGVRLEYEHRVILYHTDTHAGSLSSRLIREYLHSAVLPAGHRLIGVEERQINGLGREFQPGLLNLVSVLVLDVERYSVDSIVLLNLTGGFKPETGYALVSAGLAGASRAYYIHEMTNDVVTIPLLPISLSEETCMLVQEILRITGSGRRRKRRVREEYRMFAYRLGLTDVLGVPTGYARNIARSLSRYCLEH